MVGTEFSHYRILGQLGAGGMGTVYHAVDTDLGRPVAIKFLRPEFALQPERRERFLREARAAAALTHPNICTIHEVGRAGNDLFIVMGLVDGRTLADIAATGPLEPDTLSRIGLQLADALAEAHAHGIVHRDLKPSNIMIKEGTATILDFGVAAVLTEPVYLGDVSTATNRTLTETGHTVGTIGYMAPEQVRGEPAEPATDVFAFGVTLYEAATGRNPFRRADALQTIAAVLDADPPAIRSIVPEFPGRLDDIILKCLDKRPGERFQDGGALAQAFRTSAPAPRTPRGSPRHRSIAVLPFAAARGMADEYLSEGLTTEIITKLARLKGVLVISRSATQRFRNSPVEARQAGRELDVQTVLEGTISKHGDRFRVAVQLLEVETGFCLWGDTCDFSSDDLLRTQEVVASRVARALRARLPRTENRPTASGTANAEAHRLYLQGKLLFYRFNSTDNLLAIDAFRRALKVDPSCTAAYAALASACMARLERQWETDERRWTSEALEACERSIAQDPWISEAYSARGLVYLRQQRSDEAEVEFRRALALNPNDDIAHAMVGQILFDRGDLQPAANAYRRALKITPDYVWCWNDLAWVHWLLGREEETGRALMHALAINPIDEIARVGIATGHYFRGELDAAVAAAQKAVEINPNHPFTRPVLAVALVAAGRMEEGIALCRSVLDDRPGEFMATSALGVAYALARDEERLQRSLEQALAIRAPRTPLNLNVAVHYAFLGRRDCGQQWLAKAAREGLCLDIVLKRNPLFRQFAPDFPRRKRS